MLPVSLDDALKEWAKVSRISLFYEEGSSRRFFHISSDVGATFQIVIDNIPNGYVRIDAHLIESRTDINVHFMCEVEVSHFQLAIQTMENSVRYWLKDFEG